MEKPGRPSLKLAVALGFYFVLAVVATIEFDGVLRTVMWIFFAGLAVKTVIAANNDHTMD